MDERALLLALILSILVGCRRDRAATCAEFGLLYDTASGTCVCPDGSTWIESDGGDYACVADDGGPHDAGALRDAWSSDAPIDGGIDATVSCEDCDDGDHCTLDSCDRDGACIHTPNPHCPLAVLSTGPANTTTPGGHTCVREANGEARCWGNNRWGQLGIGSTIETHLVASTVMSLPDSIELQAGLYHTCARRLSGRVSCWGRNDFGQLGDGRTVGSTTPVSVAGLSSASSLAVGTAHACVVDDSGAPLVRCWGANPSGQIGDGTTSGAASPRSVIGIGVEPVQVSAGDSHSCARLSSGGVRCWGANNRGQLGDGSFAMSTTAVGVSGLTDAVQIDSGDHWTCAVRSTGEVSCWGEAHPLASSPRAVSGITDAREVSVGGAHACVIHVDGRVSCWGSNGSGQLGDGTTTSRDLPVVVDGLDVVSLSAGGAHTCALTRAGAIMCWGYNADGQLGDRMTTPQARPVMAQLD